MHTVRLSFRSETFDYIDYDVYVHIGIIH